MATTGLTNGSRQPSLWNSFGLFSLADFSPLSAAEGFATATVATTGFTRVVLTCTLATGFVITGFACFTCTCATAGFAEAPPALIGTAGSDFEAAFGPIFKAGFGPAATAGFVPVLATETDFAVELA